MSSSSRTALSVVVTESVMVRRGIGWVGVGWRQVREAARGRLRRVVDAIPDDRAVARVDELGEERVHDVVVERASAAGLVGLAAAGGELDLEEGPVLGVGLGDIDDQVVGK